MSAFGYLSLPSPFLAAETRRLKRQRTQSSAALIRLDDTDNDDINDLNRDYQSSTADVIIISACHNLQFRCDSAYLIVASEVFRNMVALDPSSTPAEPHILRLTDPDLEHAEAVLFLLNVFYSRWDPVFKHGSDIASEVEDMADNVKLLEKYGAPTTIDTFKRLLKQVVSCRAFPAFTAFVLFAILNDRSACAWAIRRAKGEVWPGPKKFYGSIHSGIGGASVFDVRGWPFSLFQLVPDLYAHTVQRATLSVDLKIPVGEKTQDWDAVSDEFMRLFRA